jgi:uncharacterized protein YcsI (UPF0317 family)
VSIATQDMSRLEPRELRRLARSGEWRRPTTGLCRGAAQANLVILPEADAFDFFLFAQRNPRACPLIEVTEPGMTEPEGVAAGADLRTDLPEYRVYEYGEEAAAVPDISGHWRDDLVSFLIGCSFTAEAALLDAGVRLRHLELDRAVPMYLTARACRPAGRFHGPLVVSMRPILQTQLVHAVQVTSRFALAHGGPVHVGDPDALGIADLGSPDWGEPVPVEAGYVPVFWACGVTPQAVARQSRPELMITHSPGHMFVTDVPDRELAVF